GPHRGDGRGRDRGGPRVWWRCEFLPGRARRRGGQHRLEGCARVWATAATRPTATPGYPWTQDSQLQEGVQLLLAEDPRGSSLLLPMPTMPGVSHLGTSSELTFAAMTAAS